jgi:hypothetical protein
VTGAWQRRAAAARKNPAEAGFEKFGRGCLKGRIEIGARLVSRNCKMPKLSDMANISSSMFQVRQSGFFRANIR